MPRSLETVSENEFRSVGIAGPIFVLSENLASIPKSLFEYSTDYGFPPAKNVYVEDSKLIVVDCNQLMSYEEKSFNHVNLVGRFELSYPIKEIGDFAFLDNNLSEIVFNNNCNNVGYEAFASTSYYPAISNLTLIDLSKYTTIKNPGEDTPTYQPN
ncbi:MAG: leucine-rich repeat domain-containing protein [Mycoplasmoidaceae bacterium]|nr:leucine-rich repeat domain-containing protein [Mycoplasmoidaceae bacterium]